MKILASIFSLIAFCASFSAAHAAAEKDDYHFYRADVVVVGAGSAGLTSAIAASENGARVIVLEKMPMLGGNSMQAAGYMLALPAFSDSKTLAAARTALEEDMLAEGGSSANRDKISLIARQSRAAIEWLQGLGADLHNTNDYVREDFQLSWRPVASTYTVGEELIKVLVRGVEERNIPMLTLTQVTECLVDSSGRVTGVRAMTSEGRKIEVRADAVVMSTGGFAASDQMIERYVRLPFPMSSTNLPGTTGDGLLIAEKLGARLTNMDQAMVHLTTLPFSGLVIPMQARTAGGILLNDKGHRFMNELSTELEPFYRRAEGRAWLVLDQEIIDRSPALKNYVASGFMFRGRTEEELARLCRLNAETLVEELDRYRAFVRRQVDADYHRPSMKSFLNHYPLYAISVRPGLQSTLGGLATDLRTRVLNEQNKPIPGLYAVGEVVGGVFGARRLEGSSLTASVIFGRIAGEEAAHYAKGLAAKRE